jgi:hypothetical protein
LIYVLVLFMSEPLSERREQMLGLLAEKALALACAVQQRALDAEDPAEIASLSGAFVKLSRAVRQTIGLHARVEAQRLRGQESDSAWAPGGEPTPLARREARVRRGVERLVWTEYDPDDSGQEAYGDSLLEDLDDRLHELTQAEEAFLGADPDALIMGLAAELGLTPPAAAPKARLALAPIGPSAAGPRDAPTAAASTDAPQRPAAADSS